MVDILLMLLLAIAIDLALGEPPHFIHPVVWLGKVTSFLEKGGHDKPHVFQFLYGTGMVLITVALFTAPVYFLLFYLKDISFPVYVAIGALLLKTTFSLEELRRAALRVKRFLIEDKLAKARFELRALVSRDTKDLPKPLLVSAAVESVAEGTVDSFVAPLFYCLLFGIPGAMAYRVVNTLDAMVGYHGKYEYLGKFASRLDDILNFIPARLTAGLLVLAAFLSRRDRRAAWRVALSEHTKTESLNAGWPIAAVAGALNVQLDKAGHYRLGKPAVPLVPETISASLQLMQITASAWVLICLITGVIYHVATA
ncbi:MAG: cobalamin biosynthesis protein [Dehalococcoidales bacterium]|jgi:adenosylcobinamide-phosphate synthase|nr:cobalamin biosynthesis protein [Dehalococcoidales bacterium]MDP6825098.1 cobalamin biosynthesis protein [Dehalococcoidales bacterium]